VKEVMKKKTPSILKCSNARKGELITAVDQAMTIILDQYERCELIEDPNISVHVRMRPCSDRLRVFGTYVQFVIGRSQQPHIKGRIREWDVRMESQKIAAQTGAPFDTVYELFMSLMSAYIRIR
jgi:hypothetical protein